MNERVIECKQESECCETECARVRAHARASERAREEKCEKAERHGATRTFSTRKLKCCKQGEERVRGGEEARCIDFLCFAKGKTEESRGRVRDGKRDRKKEFHIFKSVMSHAGMCHGICRNESCHTGIRGGKKGSDMYVYIYIYVYTHPMSLSRPIPYLSYLVI